jgi:hypothetical protein
MATEKKPDNSKALQQIKTAPALAAFDQQQVEDAFRAALPGGDKLTTEQVRGAALAARSTDLNPFMKEMHVTKLGVMPAAAAGAANANEWMAATGEREPEFAYVTIGQMSRDMLIEQLRRLNRPVADDVTANDAMKALCAALSVDLACDVAVLVRMFRFSTREQWLRSVQTALMLGTKEEVRAEYGLSPKPDHEAWGVVRLSEFKGQKKDGKEVNAADAWNEAHARYPAIERAKKRGRTACYRATVPVTSAQMRRLREGAKSTQVIATRADVAPATMPAPATQAMTPVAPDASVIEGEVAMAPQQPATPPAEWPDDDYDAALSVNEVEADAIEAEETEYRNAVAGVTDDMVLESPFWQENEAGDEPPTEDAPAPAVFVPPDRVRESAVIVERCARNYTAGGRGATEKQRNMIQKKISIAAKDDDLRHALLKTLTGFEHFGDISDAWMLALLNDWMKLQRPEGAEWPELCERAKGDIEAMRKALKK